MANLPNRMLLTVQVALSFAALTGMGIYPPAKGRILLVPIGHRHPDAVARVALSAGAALLGRGPLPGSWVVVGERARIAARVDTWDMLLLAAPPAGCSGDARAVPA